MGATVSTSSFAESIFGRSGLSGLSTTAAATLMLSLCMVNSVSLGILMILRTGAEGRGFLMYLRTNALQCLVLAVG